MKRKSIKTHKERWEQGFAALSKFRKREYMRKYLPKWRARKARAKSGR